MSSSKQIKKTLDKLYTIYSEEYRRAPDRFFLVRRDPVIFPHRYSNFHDIEAAAFIAATFAYGNVKSLCGFVQSLLQLLGRSPAEFLRRGPAAVEELGAHQPYYRLQKTAEILGFLKMLSRVYREYDSLYAVFLQTYKECSDMKDQVSNFVDRLHSLSPQSSLKFLVSSPRSGSPCKRMNLFLRWMVRRDGVDFGLWHEVSPAKLIMPLDTHIGRVSYRLGWIETPSLSWSKAEIVTATLRQFDPEDPTRYDFSLCHESIARSPWLMRLVTATSRRHNDKHH